MWVTTKSVNDKEHVTSEHKTTVVGQAARDGWTITLMAKRDEKTCIRANRSDNDRAISSDGVLPLQRNASRAGIGGNDRAISFGRHKLRTVDHRELSKQAVDCLARRAATHNVRDKESMY